MNQLSTEAVDAAIEHVLAQKPVEPLTLSVTEAAILLGISRALAYDLARTGEIPAVRLGRRLVVPRDALLELLGPSHESKE